MIWLYNGKFQSTLTIPFYKVNEERVLEVRLTTEESESLDRAYLCLFGQEYLGFVRGRIKGTTKWYKIGTIWDTEFFLGTLSLWTFVDIEIQIDLPISFDSGVYRIPFTVMHGDHDHSPNRNICAEESTVYESVIPALDQTFSSAEALNKAILDNQETSDDVVVSGIKNEGIVDAIEVNIDITHPEVGDLEITLLGPNSSEIILYNQNLDPEEESRSDFTNTIFADSATVAVEAGVPPFTGSFRPMLIAGNTFANLFGGIDVNGTWSLLINDYVVGNEGTLNSWGIRFQKAASELLPCDFSLWGHDEYQSPLWTGSQGGCPGYDDGSRCGTSVYGYAVPVESIAKYSVVTTYLDSGTKMMKKATTDTVQNATAVGMLIDDAVEFHSAVGTATAQSEDGRYIYEHGGQEVDSEGTFLDVWHNEIRVMDTQTGIWRDLGTCGETKQRDHTLTRIDDTLYIMGGSDGEGGYYKSLYAFDLSLLTCTQLADAPTERAGATGIIYGNEIHYIGGWDASGPLSGVDWYDIDSGVWATVPLPEDLQEFAPTLSYVGFPAAWSLLSPAPSGSGGIYLSACLNSRLYAWTYDNVNGAAQVYPNAQAGWDLLPVPEFVPENLVGPGFGYNGKIYAANPCESQGTSMRIYDPVMNSWTETESLSPVSGTLAGLRRSRLYGGKIYYWCSGTEAPSRIVVFDIATLTWDATVYEVDDGGGVGNPYVGLKEGYRAYYTVSLSGWGHNGGAIVDFLTRKTFTIDSYFIVSGGYQKRWAMEVAGKVYWLADGEYVG